MELARPQIDVGIFTHHLEPMQKFYGETLGLQFESVMPVGGGFKQYRYLCNGSVIKLMHTRDQLRPRRPGGYETIMIASPKVDRAEALADPEDNTIELVPPGADDVTQIEVRLGVTDINRFDDFYRRALGATAIGNYRYRLGETIFGVYHEPAMRPVPPLPFPNALEVVKAMAELGIQYVTIQTKDCDDAYKQLTSAGAATAIAPTDFGTVARIAFVRDPDGNFIELARRPPA